MLLGIRLVRDAELVVLHNRRARQAVPVRDRFIMLDRFIRRAMLEADARVLTEWKQIRQQEAIGRFDLVFFRLRFLRRLRAARMSRERQRHVLSAPVIASAAPLLRSRRLPLRRLTIIKEKSRIPF